MSDCFNHALDAYNDLCNDREWQGGYPKHNQSTFKADPLIHHTHIKFEKVVRKTSKAILLRMHLFGVSMELWFPLKWIRKLEKDSCYIWYEGYLTKLREKVIELKGE